MLPNTVLYHLVTKVFKSLYLEFYYHLIPAIFHLLITHSLPIIAYPQSLIIEATGKGEDSSWICTMGMREVFSRCEGPEEAAEGTQGCSVNNLTLQMDELNSDQSSLSCLLCILHYDAVHLAVPNCDVLEKAMAPHSSTLPWKIPWTEEPGGLQSMGSLRVSEQLHSHFSLSCIGEGNGNPLQCSCLENPRDDGA